mmetsp:Transcript_17292/g.32272  ORF Transcript_17292/g.32272 Transcript_17292/m.32272 type:complete len:132 (-) Transcript_17292:78-473(-)
MDSNISRRTIWQLERWSATMNRLWYSERWFYGYTDENGTQVRGNLVYHGRRFATIFIRALGIDPYQAYDLASLPIFHRVKNHDQPIAEVTLYVLKEMLGWNNKCRWPHWVWICLQIHPIWPTLLVWTGYSV